MKKKNVACSIIAGVASALLLMLWYALGFNHVDAPLDLVLSIIWWAIQAIAIAAIMRAEAKRREAVRTFFVAPGVLFNPEAGQIDLASQEDELDVMAAVLEELSYGFKTEKMTGHLHPMVEMAVRTEEFDDEGRTWRGTVSFLDGADPIPFEDRGELIRAMAGERAYRPAEGHAIPLNAFPSVA